MTGVEPVFDDYEERELPAGIRAELKGLTPEMAHVVGGHLRMAGALLDEDPALALRHAQAAKRRAGRLQVVREAMAEAAYAAEDYRAALAEYQALRRMTDDDNYVPVIADCQRALGRPTAAVELLSKADTAAMSAEQQIEATLVAAGARQDLGQDDEALRLLQAAIAGGRGGGAGQARLRYVYAGVLQRLGDKDGARTWFNSATELDPTLSADAQSSLKTMEGSPEPSDDDDLDGAGEFVVAEVWDDEPDDEETWDDEEELWDDEPETNQPGDEPELAVKDQSDDEFSTGSHSSSMMSEDGAERRFELAPPQPPASRDRPPEPGGEEASVRSGPAGAPTAVGSSSYELATDLGSSPVVDESDVEPEPTVPDHIAPSEDA